MKMQNGKWNLVWNSTGLNRLVRFRYFNRDVECIRAFFRRRFKYESAIYPRFKGTIGEGGKDEFRLDVVVEASGFGRREMKVLEQVWTPLVLTSIVLMLGSTRSLSRRASPSRNLMVTVRKMKRRTKRRMRMGGMKWRIHQVEKTRNRLKTSYRGILGTRGQLQLIRSWKQSPRLKDRRVRQLSVRQGKWLTRIKRIRSLGGIERKSETKQRLTHSKSGRGRSTSTTQDEVRNGSGGPREAKVNRTIGSSSGIRTCHGRIELPSRYTPPPSLTPKVNMCSPVRSSVRSVHCTGYEHYFT
jgi:hypothetical protein